MIIGNKTIKLMVTKNNSRLNYLFLMFFLTSILCGCKENASTKNSTLNMINIDQKSIIQDTIREKYLINNQLTAKDYAFSSGYKPSEGFIPTAEVAVEIADIVLSNLFGKANIDEQKPFSINLDNGIWIIDGYLESGMKGGTAYMEISQETGEILKVSHGK